MSRFDGIPSRKSKSSALCGVLSSKARKHGSMCVCACMYACVFGMCVYGTYMVCVYMSVVYVCVYVCMYVVYVCV